MMFKNSLPTAEKNCVAVRKLNRFSLFTEKKSLYAVVCEQSAGLIVTCSDHCAVNGYHAYSGTWDRLQGSALLTSS